MLTWKWGNTVTDRLFFDPRPSSDEPRSEVGHPCCLVGDGRDVSHQSRKNRFTSPVRLLSDVLTTLRNHGQAVRKPLVRDDLWEIAFECGGHGVVDWDIPSGRVFISPSFLQMLGYDKSDIVGTHQEWVAHLHSDDREGVVAALNRLLDGEQDSLDTMCRVRCKDGRYRWVADRIKIVSRDTDGRPTRLVGTRTDITAAKESEEQARALLGEKELLLSEVHHRVKNNMAAIAGLIALHVDTANDSTDARVLRDLQRRLCSMCTLYERLHQSGDSRSVSLSAYLTDVVAAVADTFANGSEVTVDTHFTTCTVDSRAAFPLGLIVNELLTNSFKHAFPSDTTGRITVSLERDDQGRALLTHRDDGVGMVEGGAHATGRGFGMTLVRELADQLGARVTVNAANGTTVQVTLPRHVVITANSVEPGEPCPEET
ncbi:MAG: PAS domain S-box protein [Spirochaetaceae bacterium]|nr:MAG: PAS domain S-box protein [Spirochaetaceae bacterium]